MFLPRRGVIFYLGLVFLVLAGVFAKAIFAEWNTDLTPPTTSVSVTGQCRVISANPAVWECTSGTQVTVTLGCSDNNVCIETRYQLGFPVGSTPVPTQPYTIPLVFTVPPDRIISYFSTDDFGNRETTRSLTIRPTSVLFPTSTPRPTPTPTLPGPTPTPQGSTWLKTTGGDVHANGEISMAVLPNNPNDHNADFVVTAGSITRFRSKNSWEIQNYAINLPPKYTYKDYFDGRLNVESEITSSIIDCGQFTSGKVYKFTGSATLSGASGCDDKKVVVLIAGNLSITDNFTPSITPPNYSAFAFIVGGDVNFAPAVRNFNGIILADGQISD